MFHWSERSERKRRSCVSGWRPPMRPPDPSCHDMPTRRTSAASPCVSPVPPPPPTPTLSGGGGGKALRRDDPHAALYLSCSGSHAAKPTPGSPPTQVTSGVRSMRWPSPADSPLSLRSVAGHQAAPRPLLQDPCRQTGITAFDSPDRAAPGSCRRCRARRIEPQELKPLSASLDSHVGGSS
jgi:hypothetical protein